jgi:large subunit ribosomal protein L10
LVDTEREPRPGKVAVVEEVQRKLDESSAVLLTEYRGLDVTAMADLRRSLRTAGGEYKIYKNTLVRRAVAGLDGRDLDLESLDGLLVGPTALAFVADDAAAVAKALRDFARDHDALVIKGGLLGDSFLDEGQVRALADLPSREELLARLAGAFQAPAQKFAGLLYNTVARFGHAVHALIEARGGVETEPAADETETPADDTETPADEAVAPADETETPADDTEQPAGETPPADDTEPTADEGVAPADEAVAPADDTDPTADESVAPADEAERPADD